MLWYKTWLETRLRFLICLIGITCLCVYNVYRHDTGLTSPVNDAYYFSAMHNTCSQLAIFWVMGMNLTTMGGLLREKSVGAASFTLALPFSRARLANVRMAVGFVEALAMILIPWAAIFAAGNIFGKMNSLSQALMYLAFLIGGGLVYVAIALLSSSLLEGEYTAAIMSAGVVIGIASLLDGPGLSRYNPLGFMMGSDHYVIRQGLLVGHVPWTQIGAYALLSVCLIVVSVRAIQMREF